MFAAVVLAACGSNASSAGSDDLLDGGSSQSNATLSVGAAASLSEVFIALGEQFTSETAIAVEFAFAGSSELAAQLQQGAPIDVFAAADTATMDRVIESGDALAPVVFALNSMVLAVEAGNPLGITSVEALGDDDLTVVVCAPIVPCGAYTEEIAGAAGVDVRADSLERNVRSVLSKIALGEADVGMVYVTDVLAGADDVEAVPIPEPINVMASYPIAVTTIARDEAPTQAFIDFVLGPTGQRIIEQFGFETP